MSSVVALIRSCHPGPTAAVTSIAVLLGISAGLSWSLLVVVGVTVLVGQLSIGWSNDWLDAERDAAARRLDKPTTRGSVAPSTLRRSALWAGALSVPLSLLIGWGGLWHLLLVASGWAYNLGMKKTAWSPLPYAVGFGALPLYVLAAAGSDAEWWLAAAGASLGMSAHFANAAPDVEQDRALGVWGLPQRMGARASLALALALLGGVGVLLLSSLQLSGAALWVGGFLVTVPLALGLTLVARGQIGRPAFTVVMVAAVVDVVLLVTGA